MTNHDKLIYKCLFRGYGIKRNIDLKNYPNIFEYINNRFNDSYNMNESLKRFKDLYDDRLTDEQKLIVLHKPKCKTCGKPVKYCGKLNKLVTTYCSNHCAGVNKDTIYKKQLSDKQKNNGHLGWNKNTSEKIQHRKDTLIKKYNSLKNANKYIYEQVKLSRIKKYGTDNLMSVDYIKAKHFNTQKKNNSFNTSKPEKRSLQLLYNKYGKDNVIHNYKNNKYPYMCDAYIKELDLYIEFNYHWTHGGKLFDSNNIDDINKVKLWQSKNTKFYNNAINTWTIRDIEKYNIAKQNNLNYFIFYNENDFINWFNNM